MHLLGQYNTLSTYTAQRGIYILVKKNLGSIENVQPLGNSTLLFDIKNNDNKILTIAAIYAPSDADDIHYFEEVDNLLQNRETITRPSITREIVKDIAKQLTPTKIVGL